MSAALLQPNPLAEVLHRQLPSGAFPSVVTVGGRTHADENAFVTALVLEVLGELRADRAVASCVERGLDFLETCASEELPGAFCFHASAAPRPSWLDAPLPPDADDTALVSLVLVRHGRRGAPEIARDLDAVLEPHRVHWRPERSPPWVCRGATRTWLAAVRPNPVDACVNANVAALYALLGRGDHVIATAAAATALGAVRWAIDSPAHASLVAPYYPDLGELAAALTRGGQCGVPDFANAAAAMASRATPENAPDRAVCGSLDGRWSWSAPVLQEVRRIARAVRPNAINSRRDS